MRGGGGLLTFILKKGRGVFKREDLIEDLW